MDSILTSIKKLLGIDNEYTHFDADLIMHINSVLSILNQIGVGPPGGFSIRDDTSVWNELISDETQLELIKSYIYMKVKLIFDPPLSAALIESTNRTISEFEWRIQVMSDSIKNQ